MTELTTKSCKPCEGGVDPLNREQCEQLLKDTPGWELSDDATTLTRSYEFRNFFRTMSFVNVVAHIANNENHHPDMEVGYNYCRLKFTTHAINGLSENDFICAAKVNMIDSLA